MNPIASIASVLRNFLNFRGRASRSEFWWFFVIVLVVAIVLFGLVLPGLVPGFGGWSLSGFFIGAFGLIELFFIFAFLLPVIYLVLMLAVTVRRLHDTGRSARWLLFPVIVILGWGIIAGVYWLVEATSDDDWASLIVALFFGAIWSLAGLVMMAVITVVLALPGTRGPNSYGPDPLRPEPGSEWTPQPAHTFVAAPESATSAVADGETVTQTGQRYCTQCGGQLQPEARFCTVCGTATA